jgi:hypothetical protein
MKERCRIISLALVLGIVTGFCLDVEAGEKGSFRGLAVLFNTKFSEVKPAGGHPGAPIMHGEMDGLVFNKADRTFLDKAHYQVVWTADGSGSYCFKTFSMPDGSKVFARCEGKATPTGSEGTVKLLGGTGAYTGIEGTGIFRLTNVSDRVMWDVLEWDYQIP